MKLVAENDLVLSYLSGSLSLLSGQLMEMRVYLKQQLLTIDLDVSLIYAKGNPLHKLRFTDVVEYSYYYNSDYIFYNIAIFKFLNIGGLFYLSLDPENESNNRSENDQDFILSKSVSVYSIADF